MSFSIIASGKAGVAISYGLGQGAAVVAAVWGIFIWREFRKRTQRNICCFKYYAAALFSRIEF